MKRLKVRLLIVAAVLALGAIAITQAQRMASNSEAVADENPSAGESDDTSQSSPGPPKPIPVSGAEDEHAMMSSGASSLSQGRVSFAPRGGSVAPAGDHGRDTAAGSPATARLGDTSSGSPAQFSPDYPPSMGDPYGLQTSAPDRGSTFSTAYFGGGYQGGQRSTEPATSQSASTAAPAHESPAQEVVPPDTPTSFVAEQQAPADPPAAGQPSPQAFTSSQTEALGASPSGEFGAQNAAQRNIGVEADAVQRSEGRSADAYGGLLAPQPLQLGAANSNSRYSPAGTASQVSGGPAAERDAGAALSTSQQQPASPPSRGLSSQVLSEAAGNLAAAGQQSLAEGTGRPGEPQLEGLQAPAITLQKTAPAEIQVDKPATFVLLVRNVGQVAAHDVVVTDRIPEGTRLIDASPQFSRLPDGGLLWELGSMVPGEEKSVTTQLLPLAEGEIGSVADVSFRAQASVSTTCTKPQLAVTHALPGRVLIGETVKLSITLSNPGSGAATGVIVEEDVPDGLSHPAGRELEYEVGALAPGEKRQLELELTADKPGVVENVLVIRGDGNLIAEDRAQVEVIAPKLEVGMAGPSKRYLERQVTYAISVSNPGTAPAKDVELITYLPKGLKFVATDHQGQYDPERHAVFWSLEELPAAKTGAVTVTALPIETGEQKLRVEGRADLGLSHTYEHVVEVDGLAELFFTVKDIADPIEVGTETTYEVRVTNNGSKADTNVQLAVLLPDEMAPIGGDGPTRGVVSGQQVTFEPIARLAPKSEAVYRINARGIQQGDSVVLAQLTSDELSTPVKVEESTRVYQDR